MAEYTTTYQSPFPSALMSQGIQAERRLDTPATVAGARQYNKHDVEILRIEEVIGTGYPLPTGTILERILSLEVGGVGMGNHPYAGGYHTGLGDNIPVTADVGGNVTVGGHVQDAAIHAGPAGGAGNTIPFHDDMADPNYQFVQWFLEWMEIWDTLSNGGLETPTITEVLKALWQNKYDVEIMFDPVFLDPAVADGVQSYFQATIAAPVTLWAGYSDGLATGPAVGGVCDLNTRPYPVNEIRDNAGDLLTGYINLGGGDIIRLVTDPALTPPAGNYKAGLFSKAPFDSYAVMSGAMPSGWAIPSGWSVPPGWPTPGGPGGGGNGGGGPGGGLPVDDPFAWVLLNLGPEFFIVRTGGTLQLSSSHFKVFTPIDAQGMAPVQIPGAVAYRGIDLSASWGLCNIEIPGPGYYRLGAVITGGNAAVATAQLAGYLKRFPLDVSGEEVPINWGADDSSNINIAFNVGANALRWVPILDWYAAGPESVQFVVSDEGFVLPPLFLVEVYIVRIDV